VPVLSSNGVQAKAAAAITAGAWHHVAVSAGQTLTLYVDGKSAATATGAFTSAPTLRIGAGLVGDMDEVQVSSAIRAPAWIAAQVESQAQAGKLVKVGEDKAADGGGGTSYFASTMNNLTTDAWVVVIILMFMFVVAGWVMVSKTMLLSRTEKANAAFAEAFTQMSRGLAELGGSSDANAHAGTMDNLVRLMDDFKHSSLHRIFHVGVGELKQRFPAAKDGHTMPKISERSMNAVRASLDAQLTREGHKLNKSMVLLTIAISGGPFLGLLGTVVGVMITFAAIAAAGDVNVNAIAPGIAAALVATVAGLAVAIPALFGYNYLTIKIKQISTDMHVFVDEFVTKMAEAYGG
jgi:biopolymer transport protein ExbB